MRNEMINEMVDEMLDEQGPVQIGNLTFYPSDIVKQMDPIAYRQIVLDVIDSHISDLQYDIDRLDPEVDADEIEALKAEIDELENY